MEETIEFPAVLFCNVSGENQICEGGSTTLSLGFEHTPSSSAQPGVSSITWSGPGIVSGADTDTPTVNAGGTYSANVEWITSTGDLCNSECSFEVSVIAVDSVKIDTTIAYDTVLEMNSEVFDTSGTYIQTLTSSTGCDSIVTICLVVETPDVVLSCDVSSDVDGLCPGSTGVLTLTTSYTPASAPEPTIIETIWSGTGTVVSDSTGTTVQNGGTYTATITYVNLTGDTLSTECSVSIDEYPIAETKVDTLVGFGEVFEANGMVYDATGN